jgi:hypothetical protein
MAAPPKSDALQAVYWRQEILQFMFWLKGEGLGERASWRTLERFFGGESPIGTAYLYRLVDDGFLATEEGWFVLTEKGVEEGSRIFSKQFADLTRPAHGECGPDCWCHLSPDEAATCLAERAAWL